jgi:hypothetical protein
MALREIQQFLVIEKSIFLFSWSFTLWSESCFFWVSPLDHQYLGFHLLRIIRSVSFTILLVDLPLFLNFFLLLYTYLLSCALLEARFARDLCFFLLCVLYMSLCPSLCLDRCLEIVYPTDPSPLAMASILYFFYFYDCSSALSQRSWFSSWSPSLFPFPSGGN